MATGIYHKHNALKFRLLHVGFLAYPKALTTQEFADQLKIPTTNIRAQMCHYHGLKKKYFIRLKPLKSSLAYRYKITKFGIFTLIRYINRINEGLDLHLNKYKAENRMPNYEQIKIAKQAEANRRQAEFELTGIQPPQKSKPTLEAITKFDYNDLKYYIGITKRGAIDMGLELRVEN